MKKIISFFALVGLLLTSCAAASSAPDLAMEGYSAPGFGVVPELREAYEADTATSNVYAGLDAPAQVERIVIKNANLTIAVENPPDTVRRISQMAEGMGGFVVSSNVYRTTLPSGAEVPRANITVRVPAERLTEALDQIKAESDQPAQNENINSQDVTQDYTDLQSRLRNLQAAEAQLQEIMTEARRTEDVLSVYNQLTQVREQIEVTQGRINYYEQSAALSSISVDVLANAAVQPLTVGGWQPVGVARQALQALINTVQVLITILIYLVLLVLPVLALVLLPPGLVLWAILRWRARRKQALQTPQAHDSSS
jgi:Skp family chaperone for outer membrane proteins